MKKLLAILMMLVLSVGVVACGQPSDSISGDTDPGNAPVYGDSGKELTVGMWVGVPDKIYQYNSSGMIIQSTGVAIEDEQFLAYYQAIADSGINLAFPGYQEMNGGSMAYNKRCLEAAQQVGIKQLVADANIKAFVTELYLTLEDGTMTEDGAIARIQEMVAPYKEYESFAGFMIADEPGANKFKSLGKACEIMKKAEPDVLFYVNLFPVIANGNQLNTASYTEYLDQYIQSFDNGFISYDHYPLLNNGLIDSFLGNMEMLQTAVQKEGEGREIWTFLQCIQYGGNHRALQGERDTNFQVNSSLAFGISGVEWFCFWSPPGFDGATTFGDGMFSRDGYKTANYDYVKAANLNAHAIYDVMSHFDWKGVMYKSVHDKYGNLSFLWDSVLERHDVLTKIESDDDLLVGVFEDKDGNDGFMAVNVTDPQENVTERIKLTFTGKTKAMVVINGEVSYKALNNGKLIMDLKSGEGAFVIPY